MKKGERKCEDWMFVEVITYFFDHRENKKRRKHITII